MIECIDGQCGDIKQRIANCRELIKNPAYRQQLIDDFDDSYEKNKQSDARQS